MTGDFSLIHLSDLHFGRIDANVLHKLESFIEVKKPDLVILTGDLTQRAKKKEFADAREFLGRLAPPVFVIPGNHDVPLYNLFLRYFSPYKKFLRSLAGFTARTFSTPEIAVFGFWTLDPFTIQDGKIRASEVLEARKFFAEAGEKLRVIASHHPVDSLMDRREIEELNPHLLLSGHLHQSEVRSLGKEGTLPILLSAGTATSTRTRKETQSFNLVQVKNGEIEISVYLFDRATREWLRTVERSISDADSHMSEFPR